MEHRNTNIGDLGGEKLSHSLGVNPFGVPENFFVQQNKEILSQIQLEKKNIKDTFTSQSVPDGYFQGLENNILNRISEIKLQEQIASNEDGFTIPQNYFTDAHNNILDAIRETKLKEVVSTSGFEVPETYFSSLTNSITAKILEEETYEFESIKEDGFRVPDSYFEKLENNIFFKIDQLEQENETPIISLSKRNRNWSKYSAAAAVILIGIGTYFSLIDSKPQDKELSSTVAFQEISDQELVNYLAQVSNTDELMQLSQIVHEAESKSSNEIETDINNEDIEEYLNYML